jgi:acetyl esterase/lipase
MARGVASSPANPNFVVQGVLQFNNGNTANYIGVSSATPGTIESSAAQHSYVGFTSAGFVSNFSGTVTTLVPAANLTSGTDYLITLWSMGAIGNTATTVSIAPYGGTSGASTFIGVGSPVTPNNIQVESTSALDGMRLVRFVVGGGATYTLDIPMFPGASNSATVVQLNDAHSVPTWAIIPPTYRVGVQSPWVIFDHGAGQSGLAISTDAHDNLLINALVQAGYVVVSSSYTTQNCWGNPQCVTDIAAVQTQWKSYLNLAPQPYVVAESMGGMVTWNAITHGALAPRAVVGIYPACNLSAMYGAGFGLFVSDIQTDYGFSIPSGYAAATAGYDPMLAPVSKFTGIPILMWASYADTTILRSQNEDPFAAAINAAGGNVVVNTSTGNHGDVSNFNPQAVVDFFAAH